MIASLQTASRNHPHLRKRVGRRNHPTKKQMDYESDDIKAIQKSCYSTFFTFIIPLMMDTNVAISTLEKKLALNTDDTIRLFYHNDLFGIEHSDFFRAESISYEQRKHNE